MTQWCRRLDDEQARTLARRHLAVVAGDECVSRLTWDGEHHLQGHVDVAGDHLVVIAPRDDHHDPLVLGESDWDAIRHGGFSTV